MTDKVSHPVELIISSLNQQGLGIASWQGKEVQVPFTAVGERVLVEIIVEEANLISAKLLTRVQNGQDYIQAPCKHFEECGGCALQHLKPENYQQWKLQSLIAAFHQQGLKIDPAPLFSVPPKTRRRVNLIASKNVYGQLLLGFQRYRSHEIIDIQECPVMLPELERLINPLRQLLQAMLKKRQEIEVFLIKADNGIDLLLKAKMALSVQSRLLLTEFAGLNRLCRLEWRQEGKGFDLVYQEVAPLIYWQKIAIELPTEAFIQPTKASEAYMQELIGDYLRPAQKIADLFAGCGTFSFPLAKSGKTVHAIEGHISAIEAMNKAANRFQLTTKLTTECRNLAKYPLSMKELNMFDAVIFDPPRQGALPQMQQLALSHVPYVVAVSCNPETLARDLQILTQHGYRLEKIFPIDQFLWSTHLESVALLKRLT